MSISRRTFVAAFAQGRRFQFRSDFWMNLHHFVRAEARRRVQRAPRLLPELGDALLDTYAAHARANLIFDKDLLAVKNALAAGGEPGKTLKKAAAPYRAKLWPAQDAENRAWIARVQPLVAGDEKRVLSQLAKAYRAKWPKGPIVVDVCPDTGPTLAYTTQGPRGTAGHVVIDPRRAAELEIAYETVFHEASHTVDDQIMAAVNQMAQRLGVKAPDDLWHAIIFHTAGFVGRAKVPYARRFKIFPQFHDALDRHWQPWLEGKLRYEAALEALVKTSSASPTAQCVNCPPPERYAST